MSSRAETLPPPTGLEVVHGGGDRTAEMRAWWRAVHPLPGILKRLEPAYYVVITLLIAGPFLYGTASAGLAEVATPRVASTWGPAVALVGLLALVRWGSVQGPVVFSVPDVAQLLGAPLRRADLVLPRLLRGLAWGALGAAVVGALALVGVAGDGRGVTVAHAIGFVVAVGLLGVLGVAGAALVQGSRRWDVATRRASWPVLALAVGLVVAGSSGGTALRVELWSGPWGWAMQPLATAGAPPLAIALLAVVTVAAVALALTRRGRTATERHLQRAEARDGAVAALYAMNARYVGRSLGGVKAGPARGGAARLRTPHAAVLAVPWRDAVAALATPRRLAEALALAAGGTLGTLLNGEHPVAVACGALATYIGAARLLEPLRAETDKPGRARVMLRIRMGRVIAEHAIVPALAVLAAAALAALGCAIAGALPEHGMAAALLCIGATPAITLCAALSSRRGGQLPTSLLATTFGDTSGMSGMMVIAWIVVWPLLAIALGTLPVAVAVHQGAVAVPQLILLLVIAPVALLAGLAWERFAP